MKKFTLILLILFPFFQYTAFGQKAGEGSPTVLAITSCASDTLLYEDFQSKTIPASWTNLDRDGLIDADSGNAKGWYIDYDYNTIVPGDTNWLATASSFFDPTGKADNWLILSPVTICSDQVHIQWKSAPFHAYEFMDGYKILVSTTDNSPASFTDTVAIFAESIDGSPSNFTEGQIHPESHIWNNYGLLYEWKLSLDQYTGQQIYIAFVHDSEDDYHIMIDDILIGEISRYDLALENISPANGYSSVPLSQFADLNLTIDVANKSYTSSNNVNLNVSIYKDGIPVYSDDSVLSSIQPFSKSVINFPVSYRPSSIGDYIITGEITAIETDPVTSDNSISTVYAVTDTVYARDTGPVKDTLFFGTGVTGAMGQVFDLYLADSLSSITFFIANPVVGDTLFGEIYDFSGSTLPLMPMYYTDTIVISSTTKKQYRLSMSGGKKLVNPGKVLVSLREPVTSQLSLGITDNHFTPGTIYTLYNGSWTVLEDYGITGALMLRANFTGACSSPQIHGANSFCTGNSIKLYTDSTLFETLQWKLNGADITNATGGSITVSQAGTYSVAATRTSCPASVSDDFVLSEIAGGGTVSLSVDKTTIECSKDSVTFQASGATTYYWYRDNVLLTDVSGSTYKTGNTGSYYLVINPGDACADTSEVINIVPVDRAALAITGPEHVLPNSTGVSYSIPAHSGSNYSWLAMPDAIFMGDGTAAITVNFGNTSGNIEVTERSVNGCLYYATLYVNVSEVTNVNTPQTLELSAYPNPFSTDLTLDASDAEVKVFSITGEVIDSFTATGKMTVGSGWAPGVYILHVQHGEIGKMIRVVKME